MMVLKFKVRAMTFRHVAEIDSFGDHRIAMSFLVASLRSEKGIFVKNCKNIFTSFPSFLETMNHLGIYVNEA